LWGDHEADVVIIGGGFTGLSSAYFIKQRFPSRKVMVLEKEFVGYGSSGRNTGISGATLGHSLLRLKKKFGAERIAPLQRLATQSFSLVEELIREHSISCDYKRSGLLILARNLRGARMLEQEKGACDEAGLGATLLDGAQASAHFGALKAEAALSHSAQGMLNPARFARGMKRVVESLGVEVFENSHCITLEPARRILVSTSAGRIAADAAVIATNAYPDPLGLFRHKVMPFYVYNIATEPLTPGQLERFGWPGRNIVFNTKRIFWVLRLTADNRLVFIYNDARYFHDIGADYSHCPSDYLSHYRLLLELFPFLEGIKLSHAWGGRIGMTLDFLPALGRAGEHGNIYYSAGYNGHGVAFSQLAGKMIAALMAEEQSELTRNMLINRKLFGIASATLTYLAANGLKLAYKAHDRLHD
jgi:glycine/D-amino acid oxidase-like deaminating enzyme